VKTINLSIILFLSLFHTFSLIAQISPAQKDSALANMPVQTASNRLSTLNFIIDEYYVYNDLDSIAHYSRLLLKKSKAMENNKFLGNANYYLGVKHAYQAKYDSAVFYIDKAILLHQKANCERCLAEDYDFLSLIYTKNNKPKDFEYGFKALKLYEKLRDISGIANTLYHIKKYYGEREDFKKVSEYDNRVMAILKKDENQINKSDKYRYQGDFYLRKNPDSALFFYQKALDEDTKKNTLRNLCIDYYILGELYRDYEVDLDRAEIYYKKSLLYAEKTHKPLVGSILNSLGKTYLVQKKFQKCIDYSNRAKKILSNENDWDSVEVSMLNLYTSYRNIRETDAAFECVEEMFALSDSLYNKKIEAISAELDAKYQNEKNKTEILRLQIRQQKDHTIKWGLTSGLSMLSLLFFFAYRSFKRRKNENRLEKEKLDQKIRHKTKQLTSQALMMMQKNKLLNELLKSLTELKDTEPEARKKISELKRKLKRSLYSEKDWELFRHYFEEINQDFFHQLLRINNKITPSELKLSALIKLRFNIKETASLLNLSPDSVKTARYILRKKLYLNKGENIYEFLNKL